jgi:hypothetical protein
MQRIQQVDLIVNADCEVHRYIFNVIHFHQKQCGISNNGFDFWSNRWKRGLRKHLPEIVLKGIRNTSISK